MKPSDLSTDKSNSLPYWGVLCCALFVTASEVFLKKGVDGLKDFEDISSLFNTQPVLVGWIVIGIICYIVSFAFWIKILQVLPLNIAFNLVNIEHIFVPVASYLFLDEIISPMRIVGITIVLLGVFLIAETYCRVEERV